MAQLRTLEDFIRSRLMSGAANGLSIMKTDQGWQANLRRDVKTATVEIADDPVTALWNTLVPLNMRRKLVSGREVAVDLTTPGRVFTQPGSEIGFDGEDVLFGSSEGGSDDRPDPDLDLFGV